MLRCTTIYPSNETATAEKAHRYHHPDYGCTCNEYADRKEPGVCTRICQSDNGTFYGCYCKDERFGGENCSSRVCKFRDKAYCIKYDTPSECEGINENGYNRFLPMCPCVHGTFVHDECRCDDQYSGVFCEIHSPFSEIAKMTKDVSIGFDMKIFLPCAIFFIILTVIGLYWQDRRKRRALLMVTRWAMAGPPRPTESTASFFTTTMDAMGNVRGPRPSPNISYSKPPVSHKQTPHIRVATTPRFNRNIYPLICDPEWPDVGISTSESLMIRRVDEEDPPPRYEEVISN